MPAASEGLLGPSLAGAMETAAVRMGSCMEIVIGMLVSSLERQQKYRGILQKLLLHELVQVRICFYQSLKHLSEALLDSGARVDILILQADPRHFSFARQLRQTDRSCLILYPAKDLSLVLSAFASMPIAYVPAQDGGCALEREVLRAVNYIKKVKGQITFETKSAVYQYALDEIDYFESQYRLVRIVKRNQKTDTITAKLDAVQQRLPASFGRCHQSYLVNMDHIVSIDKSLREIHLNSGQVVPSSKNQFTEFLEAFRRYRNGGNVNAGIL